MLSLFSLFGRLRLLILFGLHRLRRRLRRQQYGIDHVDHAVQSDDVGDHDQRVVDPHAIALDADADRLALDGHGGVECDDIGGPHIAGHDVVEQDAGQCRNVLKQSRDRALRQSGKRVVGRRKDREWSASLQRLDKISGLKRSNERLESTVRDRDIDDRAQRHRLILLILLLRLGLRLLLGSLRLGRGRLGFLCWGLLLLVIRAGDGHRDDQAEQGDSPCPDHSFQPETQSQTDPLSGCTEHVVLPVLLWCPHGRIARKDISRRMRCISCRV